MTEHEYSIFRLEELYDAVLAKDREKAVELMRDIYPSMGFRTIEQQRNLFPERVPA